MKLITGFFLALLVGSAAAAQDLTSQSLTRGTWELGAFAGGGTGLGKSDNTQFLVAGGRGGLVLTPDFLPGFLHGNFEWAVDVMPAYFVFPPNSGVYGASIKPVMWQWNFTSAKTFSPYVAAAGGVVFTRSNIPPGDTSTINFTPQLDVGVHIFTREGRALMLEADLFHLSSASIGRQNPGYNVSLMITVGYTWYKPSK